MFKIFSYTPGNTGRQCYMTLCGANVIIYLSKFFEKTNHDLRPETAFDKVISNDSNNAKCL